MNVDLDLRDQPAGEHREQLYTALEDADAGEDFDIIADIDLDPHLVRYQIEHDIVLNWEYADPDSEPRELQVTVGDQREDGELGSIDVRDLKPQRRHEVLLEIFDELEAGEGFELVNDHDPKPLYHEFRSMYGEVIDWEYAERGEDECRVEIVKTGDTETVDQDIVTRYDVRDIPKQERHPTIHHRYGMIPEGGTLEIVASHEPRPLFEEFRRKYGDSFRWEVVHSEPGQCRVHITKVEQIDEAESSSASVGDVSGSGSSTEAIEVDNELDVRDLPPAQRHERIFDTYADLNTNEGFILVNDHDPKPLYHQFDAEAGPEFRWQYLKREPGEFRVMIGKGESAASPSTTEGSE